MKKNVKYKVVSVVIGGALVVGSIAGSNIASAAPAEKSVSDVDRFNSTIWEKQSSKDRLITSEQAKTMALQNAGLSASDVTFTKVKSDYEKGTKVYDVEFYSGNTEYEYEINAVDGTVYSVDKDIEKHKPSNKPAPATDREQTNSAPSVISAEKAKQIALGHAGLSASAVTFTKVKIDYEKGTKVYDVEFYSGNTEYEYEINAVSGVIYSVDKDVEDHKVSHKPAPAPTLKSAPAPAIISAEKAKQIALGHAGLSASAVTYLKAELDRDDGIRVYEVEFRNGNMEYEYEINAENGRIISYDQDLDD